MRQLLLFLIFLRCSLSCFGQQQQPQNIGASNQQPPTAVQNQTNAPVASKESDNDQNNTKEKTAGASSDSPSNVRIAQFTEVLAFIAFVQAVIYGIQCYMMKRAIDQSRIASQQGLRAYLAFTDGPQTFTSVGSIDETAFSYTIGVQNSGQTPAYQVGMRMDWQTIKGAGSHWPDHTNPSHDTHVEPGVKYGGSLTTLGRDQICRLTSPLAAHKDGGTFKEALEKLRRNELTIFIYGTVWYLDIYNVQHSTKMCIVVRNDPKGLMLIAYNRHVEAT